MCIKEFNLNSKIKQEEYAISFFQQDIIFNAPY